MDESILLVDVTFLGLPLLVFKHKHQIELRRSISVEYLLVELLVNLGSLCQLTVIANHGVLSSFAPPAHAGPG